jgi:cyclic di-GMP phosphodiesterase
MAQTKGMSLLHDLMEEFTQAGGPLASGAALSAEPNDVGDADIAAARIMIVDDELINIKVARRYLEHEGYKTFITLTNSEQALAAVVEERPDVILLDVMMPKVSGLDILRELRAAPTLSHLPVIILTASVDRETKLQTLRLGATDFLAKPIDPAELIPRVRNALTIKAHHDHLRDYAQKLEEAVARRTTELNVSRLEVIHCLARAAEFRDDVTGRHVLRVGRYAGMICRRLGMTREQAQLIEMAAQLHDVGKIGIPDDILKKTSKLTPEEFRTIQQHCGFGQRVFEQMDGEHLMAYQNHSLLGSNLLESTSSPLIQLASRIALTHHERWDGTGYPLGLVGDDIPLEGRITAVADVFDALSSRRPYKPAFSVAKCFEIIEGERGTHFDPVVLDAFFTLRDDIVATQLQLADPD